MYGRRPGDPVRVKPRSTLNGAIVVNKPCGPTSHDIVKRARRLLQTRAGHTGTLDPLATGVLVLLLGRATRLMRFFRSDQKVYSCRVRLGRSTETYDREGKIVEEGTPPALDRQACLQVLQRFTGDIEQLPPLYSAVRVGGEKLYEIARRGETRERPARTVRIESIDLLEQETELWAMRVKCSSGTYIRSLAHDIGRVLGCGAHLEALCRERSGQFTLDQAVDPGEDAEGWRRGVLGMEALLPQFPRLDLQPPAVKPVRHGNAIPFPGLEAETYRLFANGKLIALARNESELLQPIVVLDPA